MKILIVDSSKGISNTAFLIEYFKDLAIENNEVGYIHTADINPCNGCGYCLNSRSCRYKDAYSPANFDCIVFCGPVYFFSLNSSLQKAVDRLYSCNLENKILALILTSGSSLTNGGVDLIESQFKRIDLYCGSYTVPIFNKVTYDTVTPVSISEEAGLKKLLLDIEGMYRIVKEN